MKINTYENLKIKILQKTEDPEGLIQKAAKITQQNFIDITEPIDKQKSITKFLLEAKHTSMFEHASITIFIEGLSRSAMCQLTRHRISSFTISSQHYQNYEGYNHIIVPNENQNNKALYESAFKSCEKSYKQLRKNGVHKEEARQVLPSAKATNIIWTINARSLINFLNQRLCNRSCLEIRILANLIKIEALKWWPDLFRWVGPDCYKGKKCFQGEMSCLKNKNSYIRTPEKILENVRSASYAAADIIEAKKMEVRFRQAEALHCTAKTGDAFTPILEKELSVKELFNKIKAYHNRLGLDFQFKEEQERIQFAREILLAMYQEVGEVVNSLPWKPWGGKSTINFDINNFKEELVDVLFFMAELLATFEVTDSQFIQAFKNKLKINNERIDNGYKLNK